MSSQISQQFDSVDPLRKMGVPSPLSMLLNALPDPQQMMPKTQGCLGCRK